jgi:hypothetical protein
MIESARPAGCFRFFPVIIRGRRVSRIVMWHASAGEPGQSQARWQPVAMLGLSACGVAGLPGPDRKSCDRVEWLASRTEASNWVGEGSETEFGRGHRHQARLVRDCVLTGCLCLPQLGKAAVFPVLPYVYAHRRRLRVSRAGASRLLKTVRSLAHSARRRQCPRKRILHATYDAFPDREFSRRNSIGCA